MNHWSDIASIVFACVTASHLGLISAFEDILRRRIPILGCPKCASFWFTLAYLIFEEEITKIPIMLAISFLSSYAAIWLELLEGFIDTFYVKLYDKIITADTHGTPAADAGDGDSASSVS